MWFYDWRFKYIQQLESDTMHDFCLDCHKIDTFFLGFRVHAKNPELNIFCWIEKME